MTKAVEKFMQKEFNAQVKVLDETNMTIDHCISDSLPDRVGDDINQDGWDSKNFLANPVVLDCHDYSKPPIGKCLKLYRQGNQTRAITQFAPTDEGKKYFGLYKDGFMSAFSVGFIPNEYSPNKTGGYHMDKQELLEYSCVSVPCNPRALKSFLNEKSIKESEDIEMKEEDVKKMVEDAIAKATETSQKTITELSDKVKELESKKVEEKSGATLSKASLETLKSVCDGLKTHVDTLDKFITNAVGNDDDDNNKDTKDYSDEEIQKLVSENINKLLKGDK